MSTRGRRERPDPQVFSLHPAEADKGAQAIERDRQAEILLSEHAQSRPAGLVL